MKALITGIGGFVGPYLKKFLLSNGIEVVGADINLTNDVDCKLDLRDQKDTLSLVKETKPDIVFHLAAQSSVKKSWQEPELTRDINVGGTKNLLDSIISQKLNPKILLISSADVYGIPENLPLTENTPLKPVSPYGLSRLEQEKLALSYSLPIIISRSFTHTGPGQNHVFVCSDFTKQVAEIEKGILPALSAGNIEIRRDIIDVRDMVKAYLLAVRKCIPKQVYNICGGKSYSLKEIIGILKSLSKKKFEVKLDNSKLRKNDIPDITGDNSKFVKETGWHPEIPIEQTLNDMLEYWRNAVK